jgi:membrane protein required for colicin V production
LALNYFDLFIIGVMLVSALIGIFRGFVRESLSLASWILAIGLALGYSAPASALFQKWIETPLFRLVVAIVAIFLLTIILASIVSHILAGLVAKAGLGGPDRALGFLFGLIRGSVIMAVLVLILGGSPLSQEDWWKQSSLLGYFQVVALVILKLLPTDIARHFGYG